ncbi:hypothetical protein ARTHRO9AX_180342 [Arthrobacter sp. 9AX]|nr:hypothetical protein ARTHRO9AX_180342 [Arthrobacter sp. 9AX]
MVRPIDRVWANRRLLLRAGDTLATVFATDDATGTLQAAWLVKEQLRSLLATVSLADAARATTCCRLWSRKPPSRNLTGSGTPFAGGGKKSKSSSLRARQRPK